MKKTYFMIKAIIATTMFIIYISMSCIARAGQKGDVYMPPMTPPKGDVRGINNTNNTGVYQDVQATNNTNVGVTVMGDGGGAGGMGGQGGGGGLGGNGFGAGGTSNVRVGGGQGIGNSHFSYPRQTPMAYAPPAYSANPCTKSVSAGGSGAPFGFSLGFNYSDDECNRRADSIRWSEMQMHPVACHRMLVDSEENNAALNASGLNCKDAAGVSVAYPTNAIPVQQTPILDSVMPPHNHPDIVRMIDNQHQKEMGK